MGIGSAGFQTGGIKDRPYREMLLRGYNYCHCKMAISLSLSSMSHPVNASLGWEELLAFDLLCKPCRLPSAAPDWLPISTSASGATTQCTSTPLSSAISPALALQQMQRERGRDSWLALQSSISMTCKADWRFHCSLGGCKQGFPKHTHKDCSAAVAACCCLLLLPGCSKAPASSPRRWTFYMHNTEKDGGGSPVLQSLQSLAGERPVFGFQGDPGPLPKVFCAGMQISCTPPHISPLLFLFCFQDVGSAAKLSTSQ